MKATLVRYLSVPSVEDTNRQFSLWELEDGRKILHSSVYGYGGEIDENMVFPCTRDGEITGYDIWQRIEPHNHDHAAAMRQMGYEVTP
jgi:hypothetical protein